MTPQIFMVTCDRKPEYVHESLRSMFADETVEKVDLVVCGASQAAFLDRWRSDPRVVVHEATAAEKALSKRSQVERRILFTFLRALEMSEPDKLVMFFEDDTNFTKNWLMKTLSFVNRIKEREVRDEFKNRYILAICSLYCHKAERDGLAVYHPSDFHCTAGFVLEGRLALELARYARTKIRHGEWLASDKMLKQFAWENSCEILASSPSLVDHVGDQSTQGFFDIRRSPSFKVE